MCIFNEKVSIQEAKVADGVNALSTKEEELRFLRLERDELQRQLGLKQKDIPNRKNLNGEVATLQVRARKHLLRVDVVVVFVVFVYVFCSGINRYVVTWTNSSFIFLYTFITIL